ncbi:hypothetical protein A1O3_08322 [Capronia epimyces CBS 606.96]|uniref:DUF1772 domain-containing protein n=1 Tax=Capronia epimyces CBS 606.96 TaxID=1182542 RepID=W9XSR9_9EURO|nr:uncharacterized protein A1O3_08322 [Capronia epimyces CBS 606.96]EXJ80036.1 hypothetical protein A1O3_08322 [Capronia epimyces CBS 606.96]
MDKGAILSTSALLGLSTSLYLSGVHFSASQLTLPILYRLPAATSTSIFTELYYRGAKTIVPLALLSSLSTGLAAILDPERRVGYAVAAGLTLATLPWTRLAMTGTIETLIGLSNDAAAREKVQDGEVEGLLRRWNWMNLVRSVLDGMGGIVALLVAFKAL